MKRALLILTVCLLTTLSASAQVRPAVSPRTLLELRRDNLPRKAKATDGDSRVRLCIELRDAASVDRLRSMGCSIRTRFGKYVVAEVPEQLLPDLMRSSTVARISVAEPMQACNDSARAQSAVNPVLSGEGLPMPYTGRGVIVGVIDSGIDFNHVNFKDSQGRSRVLAAYLPEDSTGTAPVIDGDTLPGSHYDTPERIAALTTDTPNESHGTHTAGTAAGSYRGNGCPVYGMAPEADLVLCGMTELYDDHIAAAIAYIFDVARRENKPAVINMSFASSSGPHDGTSFLCKLMDEAAGAGRVCVISAHNTGMLAMHLPHAFAAETDTLKTAIERYTSSYYGCAFLWSSPGHRHRFAITVVDRNAKQICLSTPFYHDIDPDSVYTIDLDSDPLWGQYGTGTISFAQTLEEGDRSCSAIEFNAVPNDNYRFGISIVGQDDPDFHAWVTGSKMFYAPWPGFTSGTTSGSINDLATGDEVISVGAYISRQNAPDSLGNIKTYPRTQPLYDIAYFSSLGPDARGITRPDICAPGMILVSSASRYDTTSFLVNSNASYRFAEPDDVYPYAAQQGTSMSAPVVAGIIAMWLQADPTLDAERIRDIFDHSATRDQWVTARGANTWGRGKINAQAGLSYLLETINPFDVNADGQVDVSDFNISANIILGMAHPICRTPDFNADGAVDVSDLNMLIDHIINF